MVGVIIQARMGSTRLPGKVLKPIGDKTLLEHILYRFSRAKRDDLKIIVATSLQPENDQIEALCGKLGIACFRGSEDNVLERYTFCAREYNLDVIVRMTADDPFVDIDELERMLAERERENADFAICCDDLPLGVGTEVFTRDALEKTYRESTMPHHFEHVDEYMLENPQIFRTLRMPVKGDKNRPDVRLTVDTAEDYDRACYIATHAKSDPVTTEEAIRLAEEFAKCK